MAIGCRVAVMGCLYSTPLDGQREKTVQSARTKNENRSTRADDYVICVAIVNLSKDSCLCRLFAPSGRRTFAGNVKQFEMFSGGSDELQ
jgi:hypothetical protein